MSGLSPGLWIPGEILAKQQLTMTKEQNLCNFNIELIIYIIQ